MKQLVTRLMISITVITMSSCALVEKRKTSMNINQIKKEIIEVEKSFAEMVKSEGLSKAFLFFADDEAVLMRNDNIINGKNQIKEYLSKGTANEADVILTWEADFVGVSDLGDLAYTYGKYSFSLKNSNKAPKIGVFHTIWKRQNDGSWKYVWD